MKSVLEFLIIFYKFIGFSMKKTENQLLPVYIKTHNKIKRYNR